MVGGPLFFSMALCILIFSFRSCVYCVIRQRVAVPCFFQGMPSFVFIVLSSDLHWVYIQCFEFFPICILVLWPNPFSFLEIPQLAFSNLAFTLFSFCFFMSLTVHEMTCFTGLFLRSWRAWLGVKQKINSYVSSLVLTVIEFHPFWYLTHKAVRR